MSQKTKFYDGTKLLSLKDLSGRKPEIYIATSNRSAGKTTYFNRLVFNRFLKTGSQFMLIFRYNYELGNIGDAFFRDIGHLFFNDYVVTSVAKSKGLYMELHAHLRGTDEKHCCGFAVALNQADNLKRVSHMFSNVGMMLFDEFQSETGKYVPDEMEKLISIHTSVARGSGAPVRYVPLVLLSNMVSLINPYYDAMGISNRLKTDTKYLRGNGYVLEQNFYENIAREQEQSAFNRAFSDSNYIQYLSKSNIYLSDSASFIETPKGEHTYLLNILCNSRIFSITEFIDAGFMYCSDSFDKTFPLTVAVTLQDHSPNKIMLERHSILISRLREYFNKGLFRFRNLLCKEAVLKFLAYH